MNMTRQAIEALPENELRQALIGRGVDVTDTQDKAELVRKALNL